YLYSNFQYGRCIRNRDNTVERQFNKEYLDHNFYLLLETVRHIANKLYVNWLDILPVTLKTIESNQLYVDSKLLFLTNSLVDFKYDDLSGLTGLPLDDIYDTISNDFYQNIKNFKWIIYDTSIMYPRWELPIPMLITLNYILELDNCINNVKWLTLTDLLREAFTVHWNQFVNLLFNRHDFATSEIKISNSSVQKIAQNLLYMFDSHYRSRTQAIKKKEYEPFENNKDRKERQNQETIDEEDVDEFSRKDSTMNLAELRSLKSLQAEHMYEYIRSSVQQFKSTWYAQHLLDETNINQTSILKLDKYKPLATHEIARDPELIIITLTLKNIYNYAKSLTHFYEKDKFKQYPKFWRCLDSSQRKVILDRLNDNIPNLDWFNIQGYIQRLYPEIFNAKKLPPVALASINKEIHEMIRKKLMLYIFESMIRRGVLSSFSPNAALTDLQLSIRSDSQEKDFIKLLTKTTLNKNNDYYNNAYYFLTGSLYSQIPLYRGKNKSYTDFFDGTANITPRWTDMYAMNWVSQIGFFHRYLNNRVIFITGSTGVGKSTQMPKLFLYALKAIDYKNAGSVICTEPRRQPTVKNASRVSDELGVPILDKKYYVQYRHKEKSHVNNVDSEYLMLKFVTDGTLLQEIRNPMLKENTRGQVTDYLTSNEYDIVIIDEAHEHKQNMDLILTLMRTATYYNNDLKLVIISATMDTDEPIFKRYYRDINDNRAFPLNMKIAEQKLDRINVDRRFHISPPGETTKFKIKDYYVPDEDPIKLISSLVTGPNPGTILYFQPGTLEIAKEIAQLNEVLPPYVLALPLHSKLSDWQREIFEQIDTQLPNIHFSRNLPFVDWNEENNKKGTSHYKLAVLVATNIAEASITIPGLKYVIDTGTQKSSYYDYSKGGTVLKLTNISESSRIQRRGRVGRVATGAVYYLYKKDTMINNKTQYEIGLSDIHLELFGRLRDSYQEKPIFDSTNDPNLQRIKFSQVSSQYDRPPINGLAEIISTQYYTDEKFYDYFGNSSHYDYENSPGMPLVYPTGYSLETLTDSTGEFYLIHPEELNLTRNLAGLIVSVTDTKNLVYYPDHHIVSWKIMSFWNILLDDLFISAYKENILLVEKTTYGKGLQVVQQELSAIGAEDFDLNYVAALLTAINLGIQENMIRLISMNMASKNDFIKWGIYADAQPPYHRKIKEVKAFVGDQKSDSQAIIYILDDLHKYLADNDISLEQDSKKYMNKLAEIKKIVSGNLERALTADEASYLKAIGDDIIDGKIQNSQTLTYSDLSRIRKQGINVNIIEGNIRKKIELIADWASRRSLKIDTIKNYIRRYLKLKNILLINESGDSDSFVQYKVSHLADILKPTLVDAYSNIATLDSDKKLMLSLMRGFKKQIVRKLVDSYYLSIYEPTITSAYTIEKISTRSKIDSTLVDNKYLQNYVLYLDLDQEKNTISLLNQLDISLIKSIGYIYTRDMVYNKYMKYLLSNVQEELRMKTVSQTVVSFYKKGLRETLYDLLNAHDVDIWLKLYTIFNDKGYIETRRYHDINYKTRKQFSIVNDIGIPQTTGKFENNKFKQ
ncbi:MAG: HrpA-like RNA helicase, partial [Harvfovirus sp.]